MNYILFDPVETWENLLPLTWTRPVSEIRIGILTIREKWEKFLHAELSWFARDYLQDLFAPKLEEDNILINASVLPDASLAKQVQGLKKGEAIATHDLFLAARLDRKDAYGFDPGKLKTEFKNPPSGKPVYISFPWDIFRLNGEAILADYEMLTEGRKSQPVPATNFFPGNGEIFLEEGSRAECAMLNASGGPIYIGKNAEIMEGALIRGPFALGEGSTLKMGGKIYGPTTIGPYCKIGGEINNSVFFGYSNKAHDGFLGQAVIGHWCNIGADTNNSNLKNNYAMVKLWNYRQERFIETGLRFCGLIMGDHSKCGINTMLNTGTVIGVNANIYGEGFPRNFIPSFTWGGTHGFTTYRLNKAIEVAVEVMKRRDKQLSEKEKHMLGRIFEITAKYRS